MLSRDNVLDLVHSMGRDFAAKANANYWAHENRGLAAGYVRKVNAARIAFKALKRGADLIETIMTLNRECGGIESNHNNLILKALRGEFERTLEEIATLPRGHHWVTHAGDFFSISTGDELNLPCVKRVANEHLPNELKRTVTAHILAAVMPNPCTRITAPIQVR